MQRVALGRRGCRRCFFFFFFFFFSTATTSEFLTKDISGLSTRRYCRITGKIFYLFYILGTAKQQRTLNGYTRTRRAPTGRSIPELIAKASRSRLIRSHGGTPSRSRRWRDCCPSHAAPPPARCRRQTQSVDAAGERATTHLKGPGATVVGQGPIGRGDLQVC